MTNGNFVLISAAGLALTFAGRLPAQNNIGEVAGGYTYVKANPLVNLQKQNMNGWEVGASGYPNRYFGLGFEISAVFGSENGPSGGTGLNFKEYSYLAGPQFRFLDRKKVQSNVKFLLGGVFGQATLPSSAPPATVSQLSAAGFAPFDQTKFAMLVAVPVDYSVTRSIGIRFEPGIYLTDFSKTKQSNFRFTVGPVFRFGGR